MRKLKFTVLEGSARDHLAFFPLRPRGWTRTSLRGRGKCWNDSEGRETCLGSQGPVCQPVGVEGKAVCVGATVECGYRVVTPMPWVRKDGLRHSRVLFTGPGSYHVPEVSENVASGLPEETELTPMNQLESVSFSNKKEQTTNTTMGKTLRMLYGTHYTQYVEWKKPGSKECMLYDSIYMKL